MSAAIVSAAEGVKVALAAGNLGFPVERNWAEWDCELAVQGDGRIDVAPVKHSEADLESRGYIRYQVQVDAILRKRFAAGAALPIAEIDGLALKVEQMYELLCKQLLIDGSPWIEAELLWCPNKRHLRTLRQFTGLIRLTYEYTQPLANP